MRYPFLLGMLLVTVLLPVGATASSTWQPATVTAVSAGLTSRSTFVIQAYVELPQPCYKVRIRQMRIDPKATPFYLVEEVRSTSNPCPDIVTKCTAVSSSFGPPAPSTILVMSKGPKKWNVQLQSTRPKPNGSLCQKSSA